MDINSFNLTTTLGGRYYYSYLTDGKAEAQKG